jgi:predicted TIM-barrel fold metal-dependent hydrolase
MIIDTHYHYDDWPKDPESQKRKALGWLYDAERCGVKKPLDEAMPFYAENVDDPDCHKLIKRMDDCGINLTVLLMLDNIDEGLDDEAVVSCNEKCARAAARYPGRLIAMAGIDPRRRDAPSLFRHCVEKLHMSGLKWHPDVGYYPNSREAYAVLEVANELGLPLVIHTGPLSGSKAKYSHPIHLDEIALDFPNINIVAAHSGDIFWHDWAAVAHYKKNIYGDLAMWQLRAESKPHLFRRYLREMLDIVGPEQILFCTDGVAFDLHVPVQRWIDIVKSLPEDVQDGIRFTESEIDAILWRNALKAFHLERLVQS